MDAIEFINKNKNIFFNLALILLALFVSSKIYKSQHKTIVSLVERTQEESKKNALMQDINLLEKKIGLYINFLQKKDAASTISALGSIAKESNIKVISIRPSQERRFPEYVKIPFDLSLNAPDYHTLGKFISRVENYQDFYIIDSLSINANSQLKGLNVSLKVSAVILIRGQ